MSEEPARWRPDEQLIAVVLAGSPVKLTDLCPGDRCWVIAGLHRQRFTAEVIADRLDCSVRKVREIIADPMTSACRLLQEESEHFTSELRLVRDELRLRGIELNNATRARDRYKQQLLNVLDIHMGEPARFPCGCAKTPYNTYKAPKTGKVGCREHRRQAVARCRARTREDSVLR